MMRHGCPVYKSCVRGADPWTKGEVQSDSGERTLAQASVAETAKVAFATFAGSESPNAKENRGVAMCR